MNIQNCTHTGRFKKDCCEVIWNGVIVEHDGCVSSGGCDLIACDKDHFFIIEIKSGRVSSSDANKIANQIKECEKSYANIVGHRHKHKIFLHCGSRRMRVDSYAREKLYNYKIRIHRCQRQVDLSNLM